MIMVLGILDIWIALALGRTLLEILVPVLPGFCSQSPFFPVPVSSHTFSVSYFVRFKVSTAMWTSWTHLELSFVQTESSEESFIFFFE